MADVFAHNGYRTGMFGKWHLGDNYPYRPHDRGFQHVVAHKGGGVGQTPDFWGNNYFDDTYFHNGEPVAHEGYCTDVWFDQALDFIEKNKEEPFFCYLATNAPHSPYLVEDRYKEPYGGIDDIPNHAFYGMITNIDENFGRLESKLDEWNLSDNTILIFMTDNGSSAGCELDEDGFVTMGYNAGMRGRKGSLYDGGHRVPFFMRWPKGNIEEGREVSELVNHLDLLPTFVEMCDLNMPRDVKFDGRSVSSLLLGETDSITPHPVIVQFRQSTEPPEKENYTVMEGKWRLVKGEELYDVSADPEQRKDVAEKYPKIVERLKKAHGKLWREVSPNFGQYSCISIGSDRENPTRLDSMDVTGDVAWNQGQVLMAQQSAGKWAVNVERDGTYRFDVRRWPKELDLPIDAGLSPEQASEIPYTVGDDCKVIEPDRARLKIFDTEFTVGIEKGDKGAEIELFVSETGETRLEASFLDDNDGELGAFYVYVEYLGRR
jgi:arylsulfatase A-like enzyme